MKLVYFTNSYPYGIGEQWKANELKELVKYFKTITIVPYHYDNNFDDPKPLPAFVNLEEPLFSTASNIFSKSDIIKILFHRHSFTFLSEFFNKKVFLKKSHLISWVNSTFKIIKLLSHPTIKKLTNNSDEQTVLYFYWGKGSCEMLPFLSSKIRVKKTFVRMHRYDLFEYANENYIPYRKALLKAIDVAAPSSLAGKIHLDSLYPKFKNKVSVFRCGTIGNGKLSSYSADGILRIVSCSFLSPVKRVHLMIESLQFLDMPIVWNHIGDGTLAPELKALVNKLGLSSKFIFNGMKDSRDILEFYTSNPVDLFINVSESEGVPFSIMEAFSVGIPVLATDVGGTSEIVDESVGCLLPANVSPEKLATEIKRFQLLTGDEKKTKKMNSFKRYEDKCNATKLANELGNFLIN